MLPTAVIEQLCWGPNYQIRVIVPEGFTVVQIAQRAAQNEVIADPTRFVNLCWDRDFIAQLGWPDVGTLEGYLFPATYFYDSVQSEETLIAAMVAKFLEAARSINLSKGYWEVGGDLDSATKTAEGLNPHEVVILASIIEREAAVEEERALIGGVLTKRLKQKMALGCSATLRYGLDDWMSPETRIDVKHPTPYNTYRFTGLPPVPSAAPGWHRCGRPRNRKKPG